MEYHASVLPTEVSSVHVAPLSVETQIFPLYTVAASLLPSAEDATRVHASELPTTCSVHVAPLSVEVHIFSQFETATSLVPSAEEAIPYQFCTVATEVHVAPLSVEV